MTSHSTMEPELAAADDAAAGRRAEGEPARSQ